MYLNLSFNSEVTSTRSYTRCPLTPRAPIAISKKSGSLEKRDSYCDSSLAFLAALAWFELRLTNSAIRQLNSAVLASRVITIYVIKRPPGLLK